MVKDSGRQRWGLIIPAVGLAVIIIALVAVASRTGHQPAPDAAAPAMTDSAATDAAKAAEFTWHADPRAEPMTTFQDADGTNRTLADFTGKTLVVNFWATWCAPCVKEMPTLDALQAQLGGDTFQVLTISQDREGAQVAKPFLERKGWSHLALYTEPAGHFAHDAELRGIPTSLIIDKSGREVGRVEGEVNWTAPEVEEKLRQLANAAP